MNKAKRSRKRRKVIVLLILSAVIIGLTLVAVFRRREAVITVETEKVTRRNLTETVVANGQIQPVVQVKISAEVSGEIIELPVKEGERVQKGDLLVKIKPDMYVANVRSAEAGYKSAEAGRTLADANLRKAELEFKRQAELYEGQLISESVFQEYRTAYEVAQAQRLSSSHQVDVARASLDRAQEELAKTSIYSPLSGTVSKLNSELGERVVGTAMMTGTEIMIVADLDEMEALVDIGEIDVVLVQLNQRAELDVDAFRDRKFKGTVTEIANSSKFAPGGQSQEAVKFEVKIRIDEKEQFRPGMSVNAEIQARSRTNVLTVPIQSVTTRMPKKTDAAKTQPAAVTTNAAAATHAAVGAATNAPADEITGVQSNEVALTSPEAASTNAPATNEAPGREATKPGEPPKPIEVVFVVEEDRVKMTPVERGISDDSYTEIVQGLEEGQEVVSGGYRVISRDLEDGKRIRRGKVEADADQAPGAASVK